MPIFFPFGFTALNISHWVTTAGTDGGAFMPIGAFLDGYRFDPETARLMGIAFEMARAAVRPAPRADLHDEAIAGRIIELAKAGERNVDVLCEAGLNVPAGKVSPNPHQLPDEPLRDRGLHLEPVGREPRFGGASTLESLAKDVGLVID